MKNTIGIIIDVNCDKTNLKDLLALRCMSTLPFGGRYRLIDFNLSNMVNSGLGRIGVMGSHKYGSLVDHLGTGKEWDLSRKSQDLTILTGLAGTQYGDNVKFNMRDLDINRTFFDDPEVEDILIAAPNLITSFNFNSAHRVHKTNNADVTMIFKKYQEYYVLDEQDLFMDFDRFRVSGLYLKNEQETAHVFADMLIIKKKVLLDLLDLYKSSGEWDMLSLIKNNLNTLRVYGSPHTGYLNRIINLETYFDTNMDLLNMDILKNLFLGEYTIKTKIKDNHPTFYQDSAKVVRSIVGSGSTIYGNISNSIVFRDALVETGAQINNSIIMQKSHIGKNVKLDYVILDKDSVIRDNASLIGTKRDPIVLKKGTVI